MNPATANIRPMPGAPDITSDGLNEAIESPWLPPLAMMAISRISTIPISAMSSRPRTLELNSMCR
ncbi:Uncharacterised protein [Mycobacteroides abscessus subsp. abscessus]|nr:Uncharacterised protein [Mycobacteroides abscessus subsp. abscessus]